MGPAPRFIGDLAFAAAFADRTAMVDFGQTPEMALSYRELAQLVGYADAHIGALVPRPARVGVLGDISWRTVAVCLALMARGHTVVPLNYKTPATTQSAVLADAEVNFFHGRESSTTMARPKLAGSYSLTIPMVAQRPISRSAIRWTVCKSSRWVTTAISACWR